MSGGGRDRGGRPPQGAGSSLQPGERAAAPGGDPGRPASTRERGRAAEDAAARWLVAQGFRVLARNHASRRGEVDLVCEEAGTICFVEVRSRSSAAFGSPALTVDARKARRVVSAATDWAVRNGGLERAMRFDVVAVDLSAGAPRFELIRGAFDAGGAGW